MTNVTEPIVEILAGDEIRAGNTIKDFLSGRPVSSGDAIHAAVTVGSDLLYLVPGIGWAVKGAQMASRASKAAKASKAISKEVSASRKQQTFNRSKTTGGNLKYVKDELKENYYAGRAKRAGAKAAKAENVIRKTKGMRTHPYGTEKMYREEAYAADAITWAKRAAKAKKKRNSPARKAARKIGHVASTSQNVTHGGKYLYENYYGSDE
jgi:hypothetical protein